mgnify:FL=1
MTHFMEEKLQMLESYIDKLETAVFQNDNAKAKTLQKEIIAVYEPEIASLRSQLDSQDVSHLLQNASSVDYIGDAKLLQKKLQNYRLNLVTGIYKPFQSSDGAVTVTQHVNQDVSATVVVTFEQTIHNIQELPESVLSDEEKEMLSGKLASISAEKDKEKRWEKISSALKWIAEKGIQVGIAALPYITKMLEATS